MINVGRLRVLREVAETGSVSVAAKQLGYTPSAISQQLAALERETGVVLVEREGRGIRLTNAADVLVGHATIVLAQLERAGSDLAAATGRVAGTLRLTSFPTATRTLVPAVIATLRQRHPDLRLELLEQEPLDSLPALRRGAADLVLAHEYDLMAPAPTEGLHRVELLSEPVLLVRARELRPGLDVAALTDFAADPWIVPPAGTTCGDLVRRACAVAGFEPRAAAETRDFHVAATLAAVGVGVTLIPRSGLPAHELPLRASELRPAVRRRIFAVTREGRESHPAVAALLGALHSAAALA